VGTGPVGLGGAGCPPAAAAGLAAGAAGAGFAGVAGAAAFGGVVGVDVSAGGLGLAGAVLLSEGTDSEDVDFTPPGVAGSAVGFGFSFSAGGVEGDLVSSGIGQQREPRHTQNREERSLLSA